MQRSLVMTVIGQDRPGLVESVATLVADHEGNWLESRMSRLGGQFAGIIHVEVPPRHEQALTQALTGLAARGLKVVVHPDASKAPAAPQRLSTLEIMGQDRPGIVRQISQALAAFGVNVEELNTECASAAMSGETLFTARARLSLPETCNISELRRMLEKIAADLIVDVKLKPVE